MARTKRTEAKVKEIKLNEEIDKDVITRFRDLMTLQRQNDVVAMLLDGIDVKEIKHILTTKYECTPKSANYCLHEAREIIKTRNEFEVNNMISLHISRCEEIYAKLYDMKAYSYAMITLKHKEKLMQFHRPGFHMKVTQGEISSISLQQVNDEYDVMKLPEEKRKRMDALLSKAKRDYFNAK